MFDPSAIGGSTSLSCNAVCSDARRAPYPPDPEYEVVHYETTPAGLDILRWYDRVYGRES